MTRREVIELILKLKGGDETARGVKGVQSSFAGLKGVMAGLGAALAGISVAALVSKLSAAADAAGDFEETFSKVNVLFGAQEADKLKQWGDAAAQSMGLASQAALDAVGSMGNMFMQLGSTNAEAANLSTGMVQLSADIASFHNVAGGAEEVLQAMQAAFIGEYDALQRYIPTINAAAVQEQALADTHKARASELTNLEKALATHKILMRDAGAAVGDFSRTSGGLANQQRILDAQLANLTVTLGRSFLPVKTKIVTATNNWIQANQELLEQRLPEYLERAANALMKFLELATLRSVTNTFGQAVELSKQGLIDLTEFAQKGFVERQRLVDDILAKQKQINSGVYTGKIDASTPGYADYQKQSSAPGATANPPKPASTGTATKSAITAADTIEARVAELRAFTDTQLAQLDSLWDRGTVALETYFGERQTLIENQYQAEMAALKELAAAESDPKQKLSLDTQIYEREQQHRREMIALADEQADAEKRLADERKRLADEAQREAERQAAAEQGADQLVGGISRRAMRADAGTGLESQFTLELNELDARHAEEIDRLNELLEDVGDHYDQRAALDEAYRQQKSEKDDLMLDQERRRNDARLEMASSVAGGLADMFENLYQLSGEKNKELFYLAKAAAIAEATMNVAQGVTKAMSQGGWWGIAQGAVLAAAGAVQIATISAQTLATGGPVLGNSPGDRADNIPIMGTAGEWMIQRPTTRYYGDDIMAAINAAMFPRELLQGMLHGSVPRQRPAYHLADGGPVPGVPQKGVGATTVQITNITDPREIDAYLATAQGQRAILNVMSRNPRQVRRIKG